MTEKYQSQQDIINEWHKVISEESNNKATLLDQNEIKLLKKAYDLHWKFSITRNMQETYDLDKYGVMQLIKSEPVEPGYYEYLFSGENSVTHETFQKIDKHFFIKMLPQVIKDTKKKLK